jgi:hypothetical protein
MHKSFNFALVDVIFASLYILFIGNNLHEKKKFNINIMKNV